MTTPQRRTFLRAAGASALYAAFPALAQQRAPKRIGFLGLGNAGGVAARLAAFRAGMAGLRWVEGRDYVIDVRYSEGSTRAVPALVAELIAARPDVLMTPGDVGTHAFVHATKTIPIVFAQGQDPVGNGFAASLQHPGGNATGLTSLSSDLAAKRLQLLREAFPRVANIVVLFNPSDAGSVADARGYEEAAKTLRVRATLVELKSSADVAGAFKRGAALGAQAYFLTTGFLTNSTRQEIRELALRAKVPTIVGQGGGDALISYGPSLEDMFRRSAGYVDKIFKGAKPGDLPIEQPIKFELVVDLKAARATGLVIPQSVLLRADRVIE